MRPLSSLIRRTLKVSLITLKLSLHKARIFSLWKINKKLSLNRTSKLRRAKKSFRRRCLQRIAQMCILCKSFQGFSPRKIFKISSLQKIVSSTKKLLLKVGHLLIASSSAFEASCKDPPEMLFCLQNTCDTFFCNYKIFRMVFRILGLAFILFLFSIEEL